MGASRVKQIGIYVGKHFRLFKNEKGWKTIVFAAIISLLISSVISDKLFVYDMTCWTGFFALVSACIWIGIFNSIQTICKERAIIKREHRTGLHISSYVISHLIYQAIICLVEALLLVVITAIFLPYPDYALLGSSYVEYFISYFLITYAADVLGLAVSSLVKTPATAMTIMPFVLIVQLLFSGVLFTLNGPMQYAADLTISKWGLNATCTSADYNDLESTEKVELQYKFYEIAEDNNLPLTRDQIDQLVDENFEKEYNTNYSYSKANLFKQWGILLLHVAVYAAVSIIALEFVDKDKR